MRVLHVVESYGGGVASAINAYVTSTPDISHHLLRRIRPGDFIEDGEEKRFDSVAGFSGAAPKGTREILMTIASVRPHVVHAHSSLAGALVRVISLPTREYRVVYTPHCYAFERQDVGRPIRVAFRVAESALARNTDVVAACSPREESLARTLRRGAQVVYVPNIAAITPYSRHGGEDGHGVVGLGRLGAQKDPRLFAAVVEQLRHEWGDLAVTWLGGGDEACAKELRGRGVDVTGWLPRSEVLRRLVNASVYVHTARWEGAPMALLEAHELGVPIVARAIPALSGAPLEALATGPDGLARRVDHILSSHAQGARNVAAWRRYFAANSADKQREALLAAYQGS